MGTYAWWFFSVCLRALRENWKWWTRVSLNLRCDSKLISICNEWLLTQQILSVVVFMSIYAFLMFFWSDQTNGSHIAYSAYYRREELWWDRIVTRPGGLTSRHWVRGQAVGLTLTEERWLQPRQANRKDRKDNILHFASVIHRIFPYPKMPKQYFHYDIDWLKWLCWYAR